MKRVLVLVGLIIGILALASALDHYADGQVPEVKTGGAAYYGSWQHVTTFPVATGTRMVLSDGAHLVAIDLCTNGETCYFTQKAVHTLPELNPVEPQLPAPPPAE